MNQPQPPSPYVTPQAPKAAAPGVKPKSRWLRRLLWIFGSLFALLLLLVLLLPTLLSMGPVTGMVVSIADSILPGKVKIKSLELGWFSGQRIRGLELLDPEGELVLRTDDVSTAATLWGVVTGDLNLGKTDVKGLEVLFSRDEKGKTNVQRALGLEESKPDPNPKPTALPLTLGVDLTIEKPWIDVSIPGAPKVEIRDGHVKVKMDAPNKPITIDIASSVRQGAAAATPASKTSPAARIGLPAANAAALRGELKIKGAVKDLTDAKGLLTISDMFVDMDVSTAGLPVDAIDELAGQKGKIRQLLGPDLTLTAKYTGTLDAAKGRVIVQAANLKTDMDLELARGVAGIKGSLNASITPAFVEKAVADLPADQRLTLLAQTPLAIEIKQLAAPTRNFKMSGVSMDVAVTLGAARLQGGEKIGQVTLSQFRLAAGSKSLAQAIDLELAADTEQGGQAGRLALKASIQELFSSSNAVQMDKMKLQAAVSAEGIPTALIDGLAGQNGLLVEALGPKLALKVDSAATSTNAFTVTANLTSANLSVTLPAALDQSIGLKDGKIQFTATPALMARLMGPQATMKMAGPVAITLDIQQFTAPRPAEGQPALQPEKTTLKSTLTVGLIDVSGLPKAGRLIMPQTTLTLGGATLSEMLIELATKVQDPTESGLLAQACGRELSAGLSARASVGAKPSADGKSQAITVSASEAGLKLTSGKLNASVRTKLSPEGLLSLLEPLLLNYELTPALLTSLGVEQGEQPLIRGPLPLKLSVGKLSMPVKDFSLDKLVAAIDLDLNSAQAGGLIQTLLGAGQQIQVAIGSADGAAGAAQSPTARIDLRGANLTGSINGSFIEGKWLKLADQSRISYTLSDAMLRELKLVKPGDVTLGKAVTLALLLQSVQVPVKDFTLTGVSASGSLTSSALELTGKPDVEGSAFRDAVIPFKFDGQAGKLEVSLAGNLQVPRQDAPGPLKGQVVIASLIKDGKIDSAGAKIDATLQAGGLPVALMDALAKQDGKLLATLGRTLDVNVVASLPAAGEVGGKVDLRAVSPQMTATSSIQLGKSVQVTGTKMILQLTPEAAALWMAPAPAPVAANAPAAAAAPAAPAQPRMQFLNAVEVVLSVDKFLLNLPPAAPKAVAAAGAPVPAPAAAPPMDLSTLAAEISVAIKDVEILDRKINQRIMLRGLTVSAVTTALAEGLQVSLAGGIEPRTAMGGAIAAEGNQSPVGKIQVASKLTQLLNASGGLDFSGASIEAAADIQRFPSAFLDVLANREDGLITSALGGEVGLVASAKMQRMMGPMEVTIKSPRSGLRLAGRINQENVFVLDEDFTAALIMSAELGKVLVNVNHLFNGVYDSPQPIKLSIAKAGFAVPLKDFSIEKLTIAEAKVDLGKVLLKPDFVIENLLKLTGSSSPNPMQAWFMPVSFSMLKGEVRQTTRLDLLLDNRVHVTTWGRVDLVKNQISQVLALPEPTLRSLMGMKGLGPDAMFRISARGPINNPQVDFVKAAADMGKLKGQSELLNKALDNKVGLLARPLIEKLTNDLMKALEGRDNDVPLPPKAIDPLPWGDLSKAPPAATTPGANPTNPLPKEDPAKKLLDDIFKKK